MSKSTRSILFFFQLVAVAFVFSQFFWTVEAYPAQNESHPGLGSESTYAEAVIAFNQKKMDKVLHLLNELLQTDPNHVDALQLKALALKSKGDDPESIQTYQRLIRIKPEKERAPYYFELGVILNRQKKYQQAKLHFETAIRGGFNVAASHVFAGLIDFNHGNFNGANAHFSAVTRENDPEMKCVGHYYLGLIHFKSGYGSMGTSELLEAKETAASAKESKIAIDIAEATNKILSPLDAGQFFLSASLLPQYDSNISQLPTADSNPSQASGQSTIKTVIAGGGGWISSPMKKLQWVASYRLNYNYNFNADVINYEYLTHLPSFFLTYKPLSQTSWGLKVEYNYTFQNLPTADSRFGFKPFSAVLEAGPVFRYQASKNLKLEGDFFVRPQHYYVDSNYSGISGMLKASAKYETIHRLLNPEVFFSFEDNRANGSDQVYLAPSLGLSDTLRISKTDTAIASVNYLLTHYIVSSNLRKDTNLIFRFNWIKLVTPKWSLIADMSYTKNISNLPSFFSYDRYTLGIGVGWSI